MSSVDDILAGFQAQRDKLVQYFADRQLYLYDKWCSYCDQREVILVIDKKISEDDLRKLVSLDCQVLEVDLAQDNYLLGYCIDLMRAHNAGQLLHKSSSLKFLS